MEAWKADDKNVGQGSLLYVSVISLVAAIGGLLFGYDTAVISGAVGPLQKCFKLNELQLGWACSSVIVGCVLGSMTGGWLSDRFGRKKILLLSAFLFLVSAVAAAMPQNVTQLAWARIIGGIGVGMASMLSPMYIAEVAPVRIRGRLVSLNQFMIIFGMLVVYFVNARIAAVGDEVWNVSLGWRYMFASAGVPAALFFFLLLAVPESPRWLAQKGQAELARRILARIGGAKHADREMAEIRDGLSQEEGTFSELFHPHFRMALLIGVMLAILQQTTGINVMLYYTPRILQSAGSDALRAMNDTVLVGGVNLLFTLVAIWLVDKVGRKPLMLVASAGMGVSLFLMGFGFRQDEASGIWVLVCILAYVAFFAIAMGPVVWVILSEIFPNKIRGRAMSVAVLILWSVNFLVSQFFPYMLEKLHGSVFFIYGAMCVFAVVFVAGVVPETKNRSLEQIEGMWIKRAGKGS